MKTPSFPRHTIAALVLATALPAVALPAWAQNAPMTMREQHARRLAELGKGKDAEKQQAEAKEAVLFPQATRQSPEAKPSRKGNKALAAMLEALKAHDTAAVTAQAEALAGDPDSNPYERSFAYELAGNAASDAGDDGAAAGYFAKALAGDGLGNNDFYTVMFNLAVIQYGLEQYPEALKTLDRFLAETKSDRADAQNLRGGILMQLERYGEAADIYNKQLAANPADKRARMNAVAAYQQADQFDKAVALLADAQAKGLLTDPSEYNALYVSYINADRDKDAVAVIEDGVAKGVIKPGPDLAKNYMVLGQKAFYNEDLATAASMYERAASMAADGEAALNLAKVYAEQGKKKEAREAAKQALEKGVKDSAAAKRLAGGA
jgi:tetratricopeptide (TPR) repeat protein